MTSGFVLPPYPYDRLERVRELAADLPGGAVDLSVGTPCDDPSPAVLDALRSAAGPYPPSVGTAALRSAASDWMARRLAVEVDPADVAACVGTKEFVAGLPHWLRLLRPDRDTVLYPAVSYPSYAMGAVLAGCRAVPVAVDEEWRIDLTSIGPDDAARALCLWVNTPGNPAGGLDDLVAAAEWGRERDVPVVADECYVEFTWDGVPAAEGLAPGRTILEAGPDGVLALHSLSKRSNLAGARVGFYAGDADLVGFLAEVRKHAGLMVPGPAQAAGVAALGDQRHVEDQRHRYLTRLERLSSVLEGCGLRAPMPRGGFYLWVPAPGGDAWALVEQLAARLGVVASPGEFYGDAGADHVRLAVVQPDGALDLVERRAAGVSLT
ncbi:MAG: aminotransferase class I/II-fold pyridoxal phosphate-dependent enzyme [Acidobacteria bacterium]|nr:aminotransferase class I/II-fold pyridoxal phosphate-dependent enzyme [Acidobacteriota bacterium]